MFFLEHGACAGDRIDDFVDDQLCRLAQSGGGGDVRIDPLLGFLQVELALDMPGLVSRATARASRSVLLDLFIDLDEASRRFSEAVIMGLERSQDPAHVRDKTEAAYRRTDLFDRRRDLMESWSRFATSTPAGIILAHAGVSTKYEDVLVNCALQVRKPVTEVGGAPDSLRGFTKLTRRSSK